MANECIVHRNNYSLVELINHCRERQRDVKFKKIRVLIKYIEITCL
jgi:hypothetical protein